MCRESRDPGIQHSEQAYGTHFIGRRINALLVEKVTEIITQKRNLRVDIESRSPDPGDHWPSSREVARGG